MICNDRWILEKAKEGMIQDFEPSMVSQIDGDKAISFGTSSFGYDVRVADEFLVFKRPKLMWLYDLIGWYPKKYHIDPKNFNPALGEKVVVDKYVVIPPNSFALARSFEYFKIPENVMVKCIGKSTYARCSIVPNVTPLEPGWEGHITLEISNTSPLPAIVYANEGLIQAIFFEGERPLITYSDRKGKYQGQTGITYSK